MVIMMMMMMILVYFKSASWITTRTAVPASIWCGRTKGKKASVNYTSLFAPHTSITQPDARRPEIQVTEVPPPDSNFPIGPYPRRTLPAPRERSRTMRTSGDTEGCSQGGRGQTHLRRAQRGRRPPAWWPLRRRRRRRRQARRRRRGAGRAAGRPRSPGGGATRRGTGRRGRRVGVLLT